MVANVVSVHKKDSHSFSKDTADSIDIVAGEGVVGDAHRGVTVKHRSRVKRDPTQPNLRQVHLIHQELFNELSDKGFNIAAGDLGENVTTLGIDLLSLPRDTILEIGDQVKVQITGLRNPCSQIEDFQKGLLNEVLDKDEEGNLVRKTGVMAIALTDGTIKQGDEITIVYPEKPFIKLEKV